MSKLHEVGSHKTSVRFTSNGTLSVVYRGTEVVKATNKSIILNTGGWFSNTTKTRMNQASNQYGLGYNVYQKNFDWFVKFRGKTRKFKGDRIILSR